MPESGKNVGTNLGHNDSNKDNVTDRDSVITAFKECDDVKESVNVGSPVSTLRRSSNEPRDGLTASGLSSCSSTSSFGSSCSSESVSVSVPVQDSSGGSVEAKCVGDSVKSNSGEVSVSSVNSPNSSGKSVRKVTWNPEVVDSSGSVKPLKKNGGMHPGPSGSSKGKGKGPAAAKGKGKGPQTSGGARKDRGDQKQSDSSGSKKPLKSPPPPSPPSPKLRPTGNLFPSGVVKLTGFENQGPKTKTMSSGKVDYGFGTILPPGATAKAKAEAERKKVATALASGDAEEIKKIGNDEYKKGHFAEALGMYDRAISLSPDTATYRSNRAAALTALGRVPEAVEDCQEAVKLDPTYWRAHQRLGSLLIRLGQTENALKHICILGGEPSEPELVLQLQVVDNHLSKCTNARKLDDWKSALREADAAIAAGADNCLPLFICKAEALLKLHRLDEAVASLSNVSKPEPFSYFTKPHVKSFGMPFEAYLFLVQAQIDLAFGRFENAITAAQKAEQLDPRNIGVINMLNNMRSASRARDRGNDLFKSERFTEACTAYDEGLKLFPSNAVFLCNIAACSYKLGQWERSIEECNQALAVNPNYMKALLRRAASYSKLERWEDAVRDYEVVRKDNPNDNEVAESLFYAQVALKQSRDEDVSNMQFGGEVEEVSSPGKYRAVVSSPGVSVVHFKAASNPKSVQMSPFFDTLCGRYPSANFLKVDVEESPSIASTEKVRVTPTFRIYRDGFRVKEMICPHPQVLENSVKHYSSR